MFFARSFLTLHPPGTFCDTLFCVAGSGFLNDRFWLLIFAARHDNFLGPGDFLASFWTNPSEFCKRTGAIRRRFGFKPPEINRCVSGFSWLFDPKSRFWVKNHELTIFWVLATFWPVFGRIPRNSANVQVQFEGGLALNPRKSIGAFPDFPGFLIQNRGFGSKIMMAGDLY